MNFLLPPGNKGLTINTTEQILYTYIFILNCRYIQYIKLEFFLLTLNMLTFIIIYFNKKRSSPLVVLLGKEFWKCAANLQENAHATVWFQRSCYVTLLKSHFGMSVLLKICSIFSKQLFIRTPMEGCFNKKSITDIWQGPKNVSG